MHNMEKMIFELHRMLKTTSNVLMVQKGKGKDTKRKWVTKGKAKDNKKPKPNPDTKGKNLKTKEPKEGQCFFCNEPLEKKLQALLGRFEEEEG